MSSAPNKPGEVAGERKKKESILDMSRFRVNNGVSRNGKATYIKTCFRIKQLTKL